MSFPSPVSNFVNSLQLFSKESQTMVEAFSTLEAKNKELEARVATLMEVNTKLKEEQHTQATNNSRVIDALATENTTLKDKLAKVEAAAAEVAELKAFKNGVLALAQKTQLNTEQPVRVITVPAAKAPAKQPAPTRDTLAQRIQPNTEQAATVPVVNTPAKQPVVPNGLKEIEEKISNDPKNPLLYFEKAKILAKLDDNENALNAILEAEKNGFKPNQMFKIIKARILSAIGKNKEALELIQQSIQEDPKFGLSHYTESEIYIKLGEKTKAIKSAEEAQRLGIRIDKLRPELV